MDQKRPKLTVFFKNFHNRTLVLLEVANFSKILLVNLGFGRSLAKSCLNLTFFLTPPEFFRQNKVLQQFCTSIFCQNPGIFQKFFFVPSKTSAFWQKVWRILLEKGENQKFSKNLLVNLGFGRSVAKKC